jgi:L-asparaginase
MTIVNTEPCSAGRGGLRRQVALALLLWTSAAPIRPASAQPATAVQVAPAKPVSTTQAPATQAPAPSAPSDIAAADLPRVRLVATGGTISNRPGERLTADELIKSVPELSRYVRPEMEQFANVASGAVTLEQWLALSKRLNTLFHDTPDLAGIVVTSGTDTLEELAYFLHLTVRSDRPVVVVGSMRRPGVPGYEGQANLLDGFRVAADPRSRGLGTLVVLNDEILSAREATKTDAQRLNTFQTRGYGVLGVVDTDRITYYRAPVKRHSAKSEFDVEKIAELPRVDVLWTYQGAPGDLIRAAAELGARGIVIATAAGGTSGTQSDGVKAALEKGAVIVYTTRTGAGRIAGGGPRPAAAGSTNANTATGAGGGAAGANAGAGATNGAANLFRATIGGEDLAPIKARILLMLALTQTSDPAEIQRMFVEY